MSAGRTVLGPFFSERQWQEQITDWAARREWLWYHPHRSEHSPAGFPDLVLCRPPRVVYLELKRNRPSPGHPTADQQEWLDALRESGQEAWCLWPDDFDLMIELLR